MIMGFEAQFALTAFIEPLNISGEIENHVRKSVDSNLIQEFDKCYFQNI